MICIEIIQTSGGRTGHKLKDFLTAFCFHFISNYKIVKNLYWNFPENDCNNHVNMFNLNSSDIIIDSSSIPVPVITIEYGLENWKGMSYDKFEEITKKIKELQLKNINKTIIVKLFNSTRIQLSDVYNWELSKLIKKGTYNKITSYLRSLLLDSPINNQKLVEYRKTFSGFLPADSSGGGIKNDTGVINISIHIRKGDVFKRQLHQSVEYYKNIIKNLKKLIMKKNIYIFTEKWYGYNCEDVLDLINLKDNNTNIKVICEFCLYEYFVHIINSNIFVATIGQGSLSDIAIHYKSKNTIVILNHLLRQNKFNDNMNNMLIKTKNDGNFDIKYLQDRFCRPPLPCLSLHQ